MMLAQHRKQALPQGDGKTILASKPTVVSLSFTIPAPSAHYDPQQDLHSYGRSNLVLRFLGSASGSFSQLALALLHGSFFSADL